MTVFRGANAFAIVALAVAAAFTAFYMFRLIFLTFFGEPRDHHVHEHAHESPKAMTISLVALALGGVFAGKFWLKDLDVLGHHTWFTDRVSAATLYPGITLANQIPVTEHTHHVAHNWAMGWRLTDE